MAVKTQVLENKEVNQEFDNLAVSTPQFIISTIVPKKGKTGTMWWNPNTSKFKIWGVKDWVNIN